MIRLCLLLLAALLGACAHPINISPVSSPVRDESHLINKRVAYVITDEQRNKVVTTNGGGGDNVSYYPYRDIEKAVRDALRAVYKEVFVVKSLSDFKADTSQASLVFTPEISTSSSSSSMLTWPPTQFFINLECVAADANGEVVSKLRISGNGSAEFSEFKNDFGLAGRRASSDLANKLVKEILATPALQ
jgi:hypothetical protein